eukprot:TRINITY_DN10793_c0_g1_i2.p1 TRINITY_DN10793_c0_g1~~TRINITY_DN10793_c0_g1_i2.p1  ORF type:complete len:108 (-),score=46.20 TRINITY_DN10793_c0_g1_i2:167-490(-)
MLPPKYTKSVTVTAHDASIIVSARYASSKEEDETVVEVEVGQGESHTFEEKTEDMGTWRAVRKILALKGKIEGEEFEKICEEDCEGIHGNIHYTVHKEGEFRMKLRN